MPDCFADRSRNNPEEMQRCPYLHEMKERLLSQPTPTDSLDMERLDGTPVKEPHLHNDYPAHTNPGVIPDPPEMPPDSLIGTVVKVHEFRGLPTTRVTLLLLRNSSGSSQLVLTFARLAFTFWLIEFRVGHRTKLDRSIVYD